MSAANQNQNIQNPVGANAVGPVNVVAPAAAAPAWGAYGPADAPVDPTLPGFLRNDDAIAQPLLNCHEDSFARMDHINIPPTHGISSIVHYPFMTKITVNQFDAAYPVTIYTQNTEYVLCYGKKNDQDNKDFTKDILKSVPHTIRPDITLSNGIIRKEYENFYTIWFIKEALGCKEWSSVEYKASGDDLGSVEVYLGYDFTFTSPARMVVPTGGYTNLDMKTLQVDMVSQPVLKRQWRVAEASRIDAQGGTVQSVSCLHCKNRRIDCVGIVFELKAGISRCQYCSFMNKVCTAKKGKGKDKNLASLPKDQKDGAGEKDTGFRSSGKKGAGTPIKRSSGRLGNKAVKYTEDEDEEEEEED